MEITQLTDATDLIKTSEFKWASWPFESFNTVQSALIPYADQDFNGLVAASTSAGKTVVSEIFASYSLREKKKKFVFLCPLRALANEKYNDWISKDHHFGDLRVGIYTGDYSQKDGFEKNDIIIMTSEMLNHKVRLSNKLDWVNDVGTLCVDESHMLGMEGRGPHLETALMNFTRINPEARIILLSGTLPNVHEVAGWLQSLNGKKTFIIKSEYRPCKLKVHTVPIDTSINQQIGMADEVCYLVQRNHVDKFIVFVHTKNHGNFIGNALSARGIETKFHNANLDKDERQVIEDRFKNDKTLRVIIATSTLAQGLNLPARRVIIAGAYRGTDLVPSYEILQMCGRAGRPQFDTQGDAYLLVPENDSARLSKICLTPEQIRSQMLEISEGGDYVTLLFHLLAEIFDSRVKTLEQAIQWLDRSLSHYQGIRLRAVLLKETFDKLAKSGILYFDAKTDEYSLTNMGRVSVLFYMNPFNISNWARNFGQLFAKGTPNDVEFCMALANIGENIVGSLSKEDRTIMDSFIKNVPISTGKTYPENILKIGFIYYRLLYGRMEPKYASLAKQMQNDFPRVVAALEAVDSMSKKWNKTEYFRIMGKRMRHGVPAKLVDLVEIKGIGKIRAEKLYDKGFKNVKDIKANLEGAAKVAGVSVETLKGNVK
jgi:helicase